MHQQQTPFENIVGKEEIARNEQFLLFPQCFLPNQIIVSLFVHIFDFISLFAAELEEPKIGISGKGLMILREKMFENVVGKGENAGNQHFLLYPQCFLPFYKDISMFVSYIFCCLLMPWI